MKLKQISINESVSPDNSPTFKPIDVGANLSKEKSRTLDFNLKITKPNFKKSSFLMFTSKEDYKKHAIKFLQNINTQSDKSKQKSLNSKNKNKSKSIIAINVLTKKTLTELYKDFFYESKEDFISEAFSYLTTINNKSLKPNSNQVKKQRENEYILELEIIDGLKLIKFEKDYEENERYSYLIHLESKTDYHFQPIYLMEQEYSSIQETEVRFTSKIYNKLVVLGAPKGEEHYAQSRQHFRP